MVIYREGYHMHGLYSCISLFIDSFSIQLQVCNKSEVSAVDYTNTHDVE